MSESIFPDQNVDAITTRKRVNGLTKREYCAGLAMQSIIIHEGTSPGQHDQRIDAKNAVSYADALKNLDEFVGGWE